MSRLCVLVPVELVPYAPPLGSPTAAVRVTPGVLFPTEWLRDQIFTFDHFASVSKIFPPLRSSVGLQWRCQDVVRAREGILNAVESSEMPITSLFGRRSLNPFGYVADITAVLPYACSFFPTGIRSHPRSHEFELISDNARKQI